MSEFEPLARSQSIPVRIAQQILDRIVAGDFPVGTKLPTEMELARRFAVSRPSVREALGALQFAGHVDSVRGSGTRVVSAHGSLERTGAVNPELTPLAALDLFEARLLVEPRVAALAATDPVSGKVDDARILIEGMSLLIQEPGLHVETDLRIHRAIAEICPNVFLRRSALEMLDLAAAPGLHSVRSQAWGEGLLPPIWGNQHVTLLDAIRDHDAAAAAAATTAHLVSSMLNALNALADEAEVDEAVVSRITRLAEWACPTAGRGDSTDPQGCPDRGDGARRAGSRA